MDWHDPWKDCTINGIATVGCIPVVFNLVIRALLIFLGVVAVALLIYSGYSFVTSRGDPKGVDAARRSLTFTLLGLLVALTSFGIILFIGYATGSTACLTSFADVGAFLEGCM